MLVQPRDRVDESDGVRVRRIRVQPVDVGVLDQPSAVHDGDVVGHVGDDAQVVGDEDEAHVVLVLQLLEQGHDLGLHRHVEGGGGLVGDEHSRVEGDRHGDHDALTHTAGELVRVVAGTLPGGRDAHPLHEPYRLLQRVGPVHPAVLTEHLGDLPAHREHRVEGGQGVLEDHRDVFTANVLHRPGRRGEQLHAAVRDRSAGDVGRGSVENAHDRLGRHRLPGAGLTEDGQGLALAQ